MCSSEQFRAVKWICNKKCPKFISSGIGGGSFLGGGLGGGFVSGGGYPGYGGGVVVAQPQQQLQYIQQQPQVKCR